MQRVDKGLILRETGYKDADIMLTILTECGGKLSVLARGAKRKSSRVSAAVQLLTYSEFTLYENAGRYTLNEAEPIEMFYGVRNDIVKLALGSYFAEVLEQAADSESINPELLRLGLNSLYALANTDIRIEQIKAVFEMRAAAVSGYMPNLDACGICGTEENISAFDIRNGSVVCAKCENGACRKIDGSVLSAIRHVLYSDIKRIFSFSIGDEALKTFSLFAEEYISVHFDRAFKTHTFYKSLL